MKRDASTGKVDKLKARITVRGFRQRYGTDYLDVHAPTMNQISVRLLIANTVQMRAAGSDAKLFNVDISNAFTYGEFTDGETLFIQKPRGFKCKLNANETLQLNFALYGCKQGARAFYLVLASFLQSLGFQTSTADACVFVSTDGSMYLGTHVDDIVIFCTDVQYEWFCKKVSERFKATFPGELTSLLGMRVERTARGYTISQEAYVTEILKRFDMDDCRPAYTPYDPGTLIDNQSTASSPAADITHMRSVLGAVNYAVSMTRPDIGFAQHRLQRHSHEPHIEHQQQAKILLRYLSHTRHYKIIFEGDRELWQTHGGLQPKPWAETDASGKIYCCTAHVFAPSARQVTDTTAFSDADWAGNVDTRTSMLSSIVKQAGAAVA